VESSHFRPLVLLNRSIKVKMSMGCWWNYNVRGKPKTPGEKPVTVTLCPPQISHGLKWYRTRASVVRGQRLYDMKTELSTKLLSKSLYHTSEKTPCVSVYQPMNNTVRAIPNAEVSCGSAQWQAMRWPVAAALQSVAIHSDHKRLLDVR